MGLRIPSPLSAEAVVLPLLQTVTLSWGSLQLSGGNQWIALVRMERSLCQYNYLSHIHE